MVTWKMPARLIAKYPIDDIEEFPFSGTSKIRALKPRSAPYWFHLKTSRHLGIHKETNKKCNWIARILSRDGLYKQRTLGNALPEQEGCIDFQEAHFRACIWFESPEIAKIAKVAKVTGRVDRICVSPVGNVFTVGHALRDYTEWTKFARSEGGHYNNLVLINYHLVPYFSQIPLEHFNAKHLKKLALQVLQTPPKYGFAPVPSKVNPDLLTVDEMRRRKRCFNSLVTILRMAFKYAWDCGNIDSERPWRCLKRIAVVSKSRTLFLTRDECRALLQECSPALRLLVMAGLYTGCRVGELGRLRVEDVGRIGFGIRVEAFKRSPARFVFMPDEGMAFMLDQCRDKGERDHVFRSDKNKIWTKQHTRLFHNAVERAGLPKELVFHGLRHTYASDLVRQGLPLDMVARQLGHSSTRTVSETYGHFAEHLREKLVRNCFSTLSSENLARCKEIKNELSELWLTAQPDNWRDYAVTPLEQSQPHRPASMTSLEILEAFGEI